MQRPIFANDEIYHIYNRGVEKRNVFLNEKVYFRFILNLFEFNDIAPAENTYYRNVYEVGPRKIEKQRECLVEILAFCLMPNHYHFMMRQKVENGITEFMRKIGTGYTMYFNKKYERVGALFQGKFKAILIKEEAHFQYLPQYIHFNPLDLIAPEWREKEILDIEKTMQFLEQYRWSSHLDYLGKKNFPSITQRDFLLQCFGGQEQYKKDTFNMLKEMHKKFEYFDDIIIE